MKQRSFISLKELERSKEFYGKLVEENKKELEIIKQLLPSLEGVKRRVALRKFKELKLEIIEFSHEFERKTERCEERKAELEICKLVKETR